jgi:hypothetical protein
MDVAARLILAAGWTFPPLNLAAPEGVAIFGEPLQASCTDHNRNRNLPHCSLNVLWLEWGMPDERPLTPATIEDLEQALAHALRFDGRKQFKLSGESMAKITAAHLVECLRQSGFVVMRKPPSKPHSSTAGLRAKYGPHGGSIDSRFRRRVTEENRNAPCPGPRDVRYRYGRSRHA